MAETDGNALSQASAPTGGTSTEQPPSGPTPTTPEQAGVSELQKLQATYEKLTALQSRTQSERDRAVAGQTQLQRRVEEIDATQRDADVQRLLDADDSELAAAYRKQLQEPDLAKVASDAQRQTIDAFLAKSRDVFWGGDDEGWRELQSRGTLSIEDYLTAIAERAQGRSSATSEAMTNGATADAVSTAREVPDAGPGGTASDLSFTAEDVEAMPIETYLKHFNKDGSPKQGVRLFALPPGRERVA
tara:strand:+ start:373 stop:1110 length:738 start_codon:yes stop_codon:yes gene_type:complete